MSQTMEDLGTSKLIHMTLNQVLQHNTNYTKTEQNLLRNLDVRALILETNAATWSIRYNSSLFPADVDFEDRYLPVEKAYPMMLNLTGSDVVAAENKYAEQVRARIWSSRLDHRVLYEHFMALPGHHETGGYHEYLALLYNNTLHNISQPELPSFIHPVDRVLVLDSGAIEPLIYSAASLALNKTPYPDDSTQTCVSSAYLPARGAALRATDWTWYYRAEHDKKFVEWLNGDEVLEERMAWEEGTKKLSDASGYENEKRREIWEDVEWEWEEWVKGSAAELWI